MHANGASAQFCILRMRSVVAYYICNWLDEEKKAVTNTEGWLLRKRIRTPDCISGTIGGSFFLVHPIEQVPYSLFLMYRMRRLIATQF